MSEATQATSSKKVGQFIWALLLALYSLITVAILTVFSYNLLTDFQPSKIIAGLPFILDVFALYGFTGYVKRRPIRNRHWQTFYQVVGTLLGLRFALLYFLAWRNLSVDAHGRPFLIVLTTAGILLVILPMIALFRYATIEHTPQ